MIQINNSFDVHEQISLISYSINTPSDDSVEVQAQVRGICETVGSHLCSTVN